MAHTYNNLKLFVGVIPWAALDPPSVFPFWPPANFSRISSAIISYAKCTTKRKHSQFDAVLLYTPKKSHSCLKFGFHVLIFEWQIN
jgi:hypothetical protein